VEVLLLLVVSVAVAAAILWFAATPLRRARDDAPEEEEPFEFVRPGVSTGRPEEFVFRPAPLADDHPPRHRSVALIFAVVMFVAAVAAGLAWGLGYVINQQLARLLTE
jgi:hypothetical protein